VLRSQCDRLRKQQEKVSTCFFELTRNHVGPSLLPVACATSTVNRQNPTRIMSVYSEEFHDMLIAHASGYRATRLRCAEVTEC
jgi:hypothetical protein